MNAPILKILKSNQEISIFRSALYNEVTFLQENQAID